MLYMFFADGFEEVEAVATLDVIRRAGIEITSVGLGSKSVKGSHNIEINCDTTDAEIALNDSITGVILPGGMPGTTNLMKNEVVNSFIDYCAENKLLLSAICAAPMILGRKNLLNGCKAICFPGFEDELLGAEISDNFVCTDKNIITAKGPGLSSDFAFCLIEKLAGTEMADQVYDNPLGHVQYKHSENMAESSTCKKADGGLGNQAKFTDENSDYQP